MKVAVLLSTYGTLQSSTSEFVHVTDSLYLQHFYKRDKNELLFRIYELLLDLLHPESQPLMTMSAQGALKVDDKVTLRSLSYSDICQEFNKRYGASDKHSQNKEEELNSGDAG